MTYHTQGHQKNKHQAYTNPTKLNRLPKGTLWEVLSKENKPHYYIQISSYREEPNWKSLGEVLEKAFIKCHLSKSFIKKILELAD
jgi:hypothetical protein